MPEQSLDPYYVELEGVRYLVDPRYHQDNRNPKVIYQPITGEERMAAHRALMEEHPDVLAEVYFDLPESDYRRYFVIQRNGKQAQSYIPQALNFSSPFFGLTARAVPSYDTTELRDVTEPVVRIKRLLALLG